MSESDFDMVLVGNKMELIITDLVVLNKKEKAPPKYVVVSLGEKYSVVYLASVPCL